MDISGDAASQKNATRIGLDKQIADEMAGEGSNTVTARWGKWRIGFIRSDITFHSLRTEDSALIDVYANPTVVNAHGNDVDRGACEKLHGLSWAPVESQRTQLNRRMIETRSRI